MLQPHSWFPTAPPSMLTRFSSKTSTAYQYKRIIGCLPLHTHIFLQAKYYLLSFLQSQLFSDTGVSKIPHSEKLLALSVTGLSIHVETMYFFLNKLYSASVSGENVQGMFGRWRGMTKNYISPSMNLFLFRLHHSKALSNSNLPHLYYQIFHQEVYPSNQHAVHQSYHVSGSCPRCHKHPSC
jgi:hypothetical protein